MDLGLGGKAIVISGGTSGIGLATADLGLGEGARVAICGRDTGRLEAARDMLARKHGPERLVAQRCDVVDPAQVKDFAAVVDERFGALDLLVNNAGQGRLSRFKDTTDEIWRAELELKFFSQIHAVRAFEPLLRKSKAPAIVGVNSLLAYQPEPHMVCTSAARAGVQSLLKSLATEFAPQIRVNSIMLGLVESGQWRRRFAEMGKPGQTKDEWLDAWARERGIPAGRFGQPEEAARAILFLGSPAASYITGASLEVSGGVSRYI